MCYRHTPLNRQMDLSTTDQYYDIHSLLVTVCSGFLAESYCDHKFYSKNFIRTNCCHRVMILSKMCGCVNFPDSQNFIGKPFRAKNCLKWQT